MIPLPTRVSRHEGTYSSRPWPYFANRALMKPRCNRLPCAPMWLRAPRTTTFAQQGSHHSDLLRDRAGRPRKAMREAFLRQKDLKARLSVAMHSKFDLAKEDRNLLGVVFRYTGEPLHPLSCLGSGTADIRRRATQIFRDAVALEDAPQRSSGVTAAGFMGLTKWDCW